MVGIGRDLLNLGVISPGVGSFHSEAKTRMDTKISEETDLEMPNAACVQKSSCITELLLGYTKIQEGRSLVDLFAYLVEKCSTKKSDP